MCKNANLDFSTVYCRSKSAILGISKGYPYEISKNSVFFTILHKNRLFNYFVNQDSQNSETRFLHCKMPFKIHHFSHFIGDTL